MIDNNRQFREVSSTLFKAFLFAAKELNFTKAAQKAAGKCPPFSARCLENSVDMVSMILVCDSFCEILTAQSPGLIQPVYDADSRKSAASDGMLTPQGEIQAVSQP